MNIDDRELVPKNSDGAKTDVTHSVEFKSADEAITRYREAKSRLLNISKWHEYAGPGTADFYLTDVTGNLVTRPAEKGDHFRINIPGPGSKTGEGFDWVQIETIIEQSDTNDSKLTAVKVRPATNPQNSNSDTAHFFNFEASSTFIIRLNGNKVSAEVHGRNEKPNTDSENIIDKARNTLVAIGAMFGFSELQWKALAKGLING